MFGKKKLTQKNTIHNENVHLTQKTLRHTYTPKTERWDCVYGCGLGILAHIQNVS